MRSDQRWRFPLRRDLPTLILAVLLLASACAPATAPRSQTGNDSAVSPAQPARSKTIVFGVNVITPFAMTSISSSAGGWVTA